MGRGLAAVSIGLVARPAQARAGLAWPHASKAAVSLTYDDGLNSQLANVTPALAAHGFKATFFLTLENMRDRVSDWETVARDGHEIGDHTLTHPCDLRPYTPASFDRRQIRPVERFLDAHFPAPKGRLYAYPCGATELGRVGGLNAEQSRYVRLLRRHFAAARIVDGGPNDPRLVRRYRYLLQANAPTYDKDDAALAINYVRSALDRGYWAILIFHDVVEKRAQTGETSIATHEAILDWIASQPLWCAPMGEVLSYIEAQLA